MSEKPLPPLRFRARPSADERPSVLDGPLPVLTQRQGMTLIAEGRAKSPSRWLSDNVVSIEQVQRRARFMQDGGAPDENGPGDKLDLLTGILLEEFLVDLAVEQSQR